MEQIIKIFKALSDETRLRIINLFIKSNQQICVCELMDALKLPQYTISKALGVLKNSGLLIYEKEGLWAYYKLNKTKENLLLFNFLKQYLLDDVMKEDEKRLEQRLLLRENNRCVIGIVSENKLKKIIKEKSKN
jgi:DNA-binding transcriptional ArsR family regulator